MIVFYVAVRARFVQKAYLEAPYELDKWPDAMCVVQKIPLVAEYGHTLPEPPPAPRTSSRCQPRGAEAPEEVNC